MSTELVKAASLAPFRKHIPERYRLYANKFLDFLEDRGYALGNPDKDSNVLVTANYKMSFDRLRELKSSLAWAPRLSVRARAERVVTSANSNKQPSSQASSRSVLNR